MTSFRRRHKVVPARTEEELDAVQVASRTVGRALLACRDAAKSGITTTDLNETAYQAITDAGAAPFFLGYGGFPAFICTPVNEITVHGIPLSAIVLSEGDLVLTDYDAILGGWHDDLAPTFDTGKLSENVKELDIAASEVLTEGIKAVAPGVRLTDISYALEMAIREAELRHGTGFGVVDGCGGYGIRCEVHMDPFLPSEDKAGKGPRIVEGFMLTVKPMLILGSGWGSDEFDDGQTIVSTDRVPAFHWGRTVATTTDGPRILTP